MTWAELRPAFAKRRYPCAERASAHGLIARNNHFTEKPGGVKKRTNKHPTLQDHYELVLILKQRRWMCTNPECKYSISDSFKFVNKGRRTTNATDMLIVYAYRDLMETTTSFADRFHVSDTYAHEVFNRYVKMDRLSLTDAICIDEVFLDMDEHCKYALDIQDFHTGDPIVLLRNRRKNVTEPYFANLPPAERNGVKYLISDMYNQYIDYVDKYFPMRFLSWIPFM